MRMKNEHDLRKTPRLPHVDHYETHYSLVQQNVRIEKFVSFDMTDLNFKGLGVQTKEPLPVDALVNFDIYFDGEHYNVTAKVLWTKSNEQRYRSGLAFEEIPEALIYSIKHYLSEFATKRYQN
jgi:hypothetical protein